MLSLASSLDVHTYVLKLAINFTDVIVVDDSYCCYYHFIASRFICMHCADKKLVVYMTNI